MYVQSSPLILWARTGHGDISYLIMDPDSAVASQYSSQKFRHFERRRGLFFLFPSWLDMEFLAFGLGRLGYLCCQSLPPISWGFCFVLARLWLWKNIFIRSVVVSCFNSISFLSPSQFPSLPTLHTYITSHITTQHNPFNLNPCRQTIWKTPKITAKSPPPA